MTNLSTLHFHRAPNPRRQTQEHDTVAAWLTEWGTLYLRDVIWKAFGAVSTEQFIFQLDFVILPERGRNPAKYVLVEIAPERKSITLMQRDSARRNLLKALWSGKVLMLEASDIRAHPDIAQVRLLNALN